MIASGSRRNVLWLSLAACALVPPCLLFWSHQRVDRDFHDLWMLLSRAREMAGQDGPTTVAFSDSFAVMRDRQGRQIESLWLPTLEEVRYTTKAGDRTIVFAPATSPYNIHLHGGDIALRAWTGRGRSIWVHCTGGLTEGRNDDWALNGAHAVGP